MIFKKEKLRARLFVSRCMFSRCITLIKSIECIVFMANLGWPKYSVQSF